jgi:hypothetical protein
MGHRISHLALGAVVVATPFGAWTSDALGQTYSVISLTPAPGNLGTLVAQSLTTVTMTLGASGGMITPSGSILHSPSVPYSVTVQCIDGPGGKKRCSTHDMVLVIATAGATSQSTRIGTLGDFTIANNTQPITGGPLSSATATTYTLGALAGSATATFNVGFTFPLLSSGTTGLSTTRTFTITVGNTNELGSPTAAYMVASVFHPISIAATSTMAFGEILAPYTGTATYTLSPSAPATLSASGGGAVFRANTVTPTAAAFTVTGEGSELFQLNVPASLIMTGTGGNLTVSTTSSFGGAGVLTTQTFLGSLGNYGTFPFQVGGTLPVSAGTPSGAYTGSLIVTVNYD